VGAEFVDVTRVTQEKNLQEQQLKEFRYRCFTCKCLFSCVAGWKIHTEFMLLCGRKCICDVFSYSKYSHSLMGTSEEKVQRTICEKDLRKFEALVEATMKNPEIIKPEKRKPLLETKRDVQRQESLKFIKANKDKLASVEKWLAGLTQGNARQELKQLGDPICDAIVYPRCPKLFGEDITEHDSKLMLFLKSHSISVRSVSNTSNSDPTTAFVYLHDSDNKYTSLLIEKL
jgi:hypothetical protein